MNTQIQIEQSRIAGRWTKEQHEKFLYGLKLYGKNWKKIQTIIQTRSSTQIRSHAQKYFIKIKKTGEMEDQDQSQIIQNSSLIKSEIENITCPCEIRSENGEKSQKSSFSFFMERIVNNIYIHQNQGKTFNFWNLLIDSPRIQKTHSCELISVQKKQDSFELQFNNKLTQSKSKQNFRSIENEQGENLKRWNVQFVDLDEIESEPCKRLKLQQ